MTGTQIQRQGAREPVTSPFGRARGLNRLGENMGHESAAPTEGSGLDQAAQQQLGTSDFKDNTARKTQKSTSPHSRVDAPEIPSRPIEDRERTLAGQLHLLSNEFIND